MMEMKRTKRTVRARVEKPMHKHISTNPTVQKMALETIAGSGYLMVHKRVLCEYGPSVTVFLSHIIDKFLYFDGNDKLQSDGSFFLRHEDMSTQTGMNDYELRKCKKILKECKIISTIMKGLPQKEFYFLHLDKLVQEYQRINPLNFKGIGVQNLKEYIIRPNKTKPNTINKNPQNHSDSDWILNLFPQEWKNDKSFQESIKDFIQHRKEKGSKLTKVAASRLSKKLTNHPIQIATQALELSMENGWQGVFPESVSKGSAKKSGNVSIGTMNMKSYPQDCVFPTGETYNQEGDQE